MKATDEDAVTRLLSAPSSGGQVGESLLEMTRGDVPASRRY
jgi:hypothetical protein